MPTKVEVAYADLGDVKQVELWISDAGFVFNANEAGVAIAEAPTWREACGMALDDLRGGIRPRGYVLEGPR